MTYQNLKFLINVLAYCLTILPFFNDFDSYKSRSDTNSSTMKPLSSKRMIRLEKKKKKMAALLEITKLNAQDRNNKTSTIPQSETALEHVPSREPSPKRLRTEDKCEDGNEENNLQSNDNEVENTECVLGDSGKVKLTGVEYLKLKKSLREQSNKLRILPKLWLRDLGTAASLKVDVENRVPLFLSDIQHLIMYSLLGCHSPYNPAKWCQLDKLSKLQNVCIFVVENISMYDYFSHESLFPFTSSTFEHKLEYLNPESYKVDFVQDILMVPVTTTQMKKYVNQYSSLEEAVNKTDCLFKITKNFFPIDKEVLNEKDKCKPEKDKFPRTHLMLSGWQMVEENIPLPIKGLMERKYSDYVLSKNVYAEVTASSPMYGLDCEMCMTTSGDLELTRVSIVDEDHQTFYEALVKPDNKITDYLTRYSGITPSMMRPVRTRLKHVQEDLRRMLPSDAILVGQSISGDLHALKMMHPYIIDSSVIYNLTGERARKTKLKTLAKEFLQENIQDGRNGHCSTEDSLATLKLVQLKLTKSLSYGDAVLSNVRDEIRHYSELGNSNFATSMLHHVTKMEKKASVVALEDIVNNYCYFTYKDNVPQTNKIVFTSGNNNKAVVTKLCSSVKNFSLNIGHVKLTNVEENKEKLYKEVDNWIKQVYEHSSTPSFNIVIFNGGTGTSNGCCFLKIKTVDNNNVSNPE